MSRSSYSEDIDEWALIRWRGAVASAIRGKRGQAFLRELLAALDALPEKRLILDDLMSLDGVCAMGAVALSRNLDVSKVDAYDPEAVASVFGVAHALAAEIAYENDEGVFFRETPEERFARMRAWVVEKLEAK